LPIVGTLISFLGLGFPLAAVLAHKRPRLATAVAKAVLAAKLRQPGTEQLKHGVGYYVQLRRRQPEYGQA
jgi:hypothetical protein